MNKPFGYNPFVLERCLNMPEVSLTDMIYHFVLAKLIESNNNKLHLSEKIGVPLRTLRNKIHEIKSRGYPVPEPNVGKQKWTSKEQIKYENRIGLNRSKRIIRPPQLP